MRRHTLLFAFVLLFARAPVWAQTNITSTQCASIGISKDSSTVAIQVTGTWTGTLQPEIALQGQAAQNTQVTPSTSTTAQATITANGVFYANTPGGAPSVFYLCGNTVASGTAVVYLNLSSGVSAGALGAGGGAGGVSIVTNGLIGNFQMTDSGTTTLTDSSGSGNNGTFPGGGNNPTRISANGLNVGLNFVAASSQYVSLPTALNSFVTAIIVTGFGLQPSTGSFGQWYSPLATGTGGTNAIALFYAGYNTADPRIQQLQTVGAGSETSYSPIPPLGIRVIGWQRQAVHDFPAVDALGFNYLNTVGLGMTPTSAVTPTGNLWLGGGNSTASGLLAASQGANAFNGNIYMALFYNRAITDAEYETDYIAIQQLMAQRGIVVPQPNPGSCVDPMTSGPGQLCAQTNLQSSNFVLMIGDSENASLVGSSLTLPAGITAFNLGVAGTKPEFDVALMPISTQPMLPTAGSQNAIFWWSGTNDSGANASRTQDVIQAASKRWRQQGWRVLFGTMMSRTTGDTFKNSLNTAVRGNWQQWFDGLIDIGGDVNLGCDGCSANNTYFTGGLHMSAHTNNNIVQPMVNRAIARLFGARDFSAAATRTATPAAQTTTAGSESTNTVTLTFGANVFPVGAMMQCTGITPAGYNNATGPGWQVLTSSGTQVTFYNPTSGLGAITVQGSCTIPEQQDGDQYVLVNQGSGNFTMETCDGFTGQTVYIKNINAASLTIAANGSETIDGGATISLAQNKIAGLQSFVISSSAAGCNWRQVQ